jgi:hypothetical protein
VTLPEHRFHPQDLEMIRRMIPKPARASIAGPSPVDRSLLAAKSLRDRQLSVSTPRDGMGGGLLEAARRSGGPPDVPVVAVNRMKRWISHVDPT